MANLRRVADKVQRIRTNDRAGDQIAEHGTQPQPRRDRYSDSRRGQIDEGLDEDRVH